MNCAVQIRMFACLFCICFASGAEHVTIKPPLPTGGVEGYCRIQREGNPDLSDSDLAVRVILQNRDFFCLNPDHEKLSGMYSLSAEEKDAFVARCMKKGVLNSAHMAARLEKTDPELVPESSARAMLRLGMEDVFNRKYRSKSRIGEVEMKLDESASDLIVRATIALSAGSEAEPRPLGAPLKIVSNASEERGSDRHLIAFRIGGVFRIATRYAFCYFENDTVTLTADIPFAQLRSFSGEMELLGFLPLHGVCVKKVMVNSNGL